MVNYETWYNSLNDEDIEQLDIEVDEGNDHAYTDSYNSFLKEMYPIDITTTIDDSDIIDIPDNALNTISIKLKDDE